jgi:formylglycine-generating enzyme required for sulfatase activity
MFGVLTPVKLESGDYMIVNLKTGEVTYENIETDQATANTKYNTDECKTTKMVFRKVSAGTYYVGTTTTADMAKDFYIGIFEVTVGQYTLMNNKNASVSVTLANMKPKDNVSWETIRGTSSVPSSFAGNLSSGPIYKLHSTVAAAGGDVVFDLPTAGMWVVATRAMPAEDSSHVTWPWFFGSTDSDLGTYAWYTTNSSGATHKVGTKSANQWGVYDIYGNLAEWCLDFTLSQTPSGSSATTGNLPTRGGYFGNDSYWCRSDNTFPAARSTSSGAYGFRLACICQ